MINPFITNPALRGLIKKLKIDSERKTALLEKLPRLDEEERLKLFETLKKIFLLDLEEKRAIERIKKYWKK
ncbi:hypothetical protein KAU51_00100 [Candidatus Parcubacteria bacterium]|nr:hypothetical protein [Candidatus Parcubacteria bacterium]